MTQTGIHEGKMKPLTAACSQSLRSVQRSDTDNISVALSTQFWIYTLYTVAYNVVIK